MTETTIYRTIAVLLAAMIVGLSISAATDRVVAAINATAACRR